MSDGNPAKDAWNAATELLRADCSLSDSQAAFVRMAHPLAWVDEIFMIAVGSEFVKTWIEEHVSETMTSMLSNILGRSVRIVISVDPSVNESQPVGTMASSIAPSAVAPSVLAASEDPLPASSLTMPSLAPSSLASSGVEAEEGDASDSATSDYSQPRYPGMSRSSEHSFSETAKYRESSTDVEAGYARPRPRHLDTSGSGGEPLLPSKPDESHESFTQGIRYVDQTTIAEEALAKRPDTAARSQKARINPRYTFDNFVIGDNNRFATATSLAVAESPGTTYNPLFLYSDSGMGKTHLMHAIGNYALNLFPSIKVRYVSAEEFTNAFINSVRDGHQAEFKNQFRTVDILLIDDIQFIGGRDSTVEEFFHTFNALTNSNKQIVITSDVSPNLLNGFEERMLSRFNSGVTANIDRPNLETRIAILEKKAHSDGFTVPREVNEYIATHMLTNVREMEGALRRVTAFADLSKQTISLGLAEMILKDLIANPDAIEITATLIMSQTAGYFDISIEEMISTDRSRVLVSARQVAMYLCREMTELSLPKIGHLFGKRDHTTVMHACRKIDKQMAERQTTYNQVSELTSRIKQAAQQASL